MPLNDDIIKTFKLSWGICKPYDNILAKIDYFEQRVDEGLNIHCHKIEKENKMNKNEELKHVDTIIITRKGNTVSAEAFEVGSGGGLPVNRATAECSPDDIFDFNIGAKIAFDRLYEGYDMTPKPKRKPYNGLIYIEKYPGSALKNKSIYRVKDGVIQKCMFGAGPFIYEGMSDEELSTVIDDVVYGRHTINFGLTHEEENRYPLTAAHFIIYDKT